MLRNWISNGLNLLLQVTFSCAVCLSSLSAQEQNFVDIKPSPQQVEWQDLEMGAIIHFGPNTFLNQEWGDGTADPKVFNPTQFDPEQWMRALRSAGINYVVFVAKHHDGFCLWPSADTDYSVKSSPWENGQGNVAKRVEEAARKYGLKFGVYLSPWDRHEPRYSTGEYDKYYAAQLDELAENYGDLVEFWLDGAGSGGHVYNFPHIIEELRMSQPNTLVFADVALFEYGDIRWVGNEQGKITYENWNVVDRHGYLRWRPVEADTPLRKEHWFWHPNDEGSLKTLDELMTTYEQTVGRGGQLMLGIAPDRRGLLPDVDVERLKQFGAAMKERYGSNLMTAARSSGGGEQKAAFDEDTDTFWSAPAGSHHAVLEADFSAPVTFDRSLVMERLNEGQHVEHFRVEVWDHQHWKSVTEGRAIGHKRIDQFPRVTTTRVRLNILSSTAEAEIREFQIFDSKESH
jgi:alpha-L-fucosidase